MKHHREVIERLRGKLIVSCQPVPGGPFDNLEAIVAYACAVEATGASGLRIEGATNVAGVSKLTHIPIVGLVKRDLTDSPVRITPLLSDVIDLCEAGADIIAIDATDRPRPVALAELIAEVKRRGRLAMADISTEAEARSALAAGFHIVGTTMSGYTGEVAPPKMPDLELVRICKHLNAPVFAEGRYNSPEMAGDAIRAGAHAVVVGSAITRPEHVTEWFRVAVERAAGIFEPMLAFDIGGTKTLAALVQGSTVIERRVIQTPSDVGGEDWIDRIVDLTTGWSGRYARVAAAVTGRIEGDVWSALNPCTLAIPAKFALAKVLERRLNSHVHVVNDAQAAAWGEYRFGAGQGKDLVFLTVSSGIGGGIVLNGRLLHGANGVAGSLGQVPSNGKTGLTRLETLASGFGIGQGALQKGYESDARSVFAAARAGEKWASDVLADAITPLAQAIVGLQALVDPDCIVIGGGVGLAEGFLDLLRASLERYPEVFSPVIVPAELGADAGVIGVADIASKS
ncbi:putative N-acetylmannosamine-6-phosphate 2-epimerase [Agrobacterium sp. 22-211-1]